MKRFILVLAGLLLTHIAIAQTPFGWRVGVAAWTFNRFSLYEAVDKTAALGIPCIEAFDGQKLTPDSDAVFSPAMSDEQIQQLRAKLDGAKMTLTSFYTNTIPTDEAACRAFFEFAKKLGVGFIVSEPAPEALDGIEKCCNEYGINLAIHNHPQGSSRYWDPAEVMKVCAGRGPRIGACGDTGHWLRSGIVPADAVRVLGKRLLAVHLKDLDKAAPDAVDTPWGQGCGNLDAVLRAVREVRATPALFAIEYETKMENNMPEADACAKWFAERAAALLAETKREDPLYVGWAQVDITPPRPVALVGQFHKRLSTGALDPLTATALALETRAADGSTEQAVFLSCDLCGCFGSITARLREMVKERIPDLDPRKIALNGTHTHDGPGMDDATYGTRYDVSGDPGAMTGSEYGAFFLEKALEAIAAAWNGRAPGGMSWALGSAAVGINRRVQYTDGTAKMYGDVAVDTFDRFEGTTDPGVLLLYFWDQEQQLTGAVVNIACPSQETESLMQLSADFWHETRQEIRKRVGKDIFILPQCAAAGDQSPHRMFRKEAEEEMLRRKGISRRQEIAQRIATAVDDTLPGAKGAIKTALPLKHAIVAADLAEVDPPRTPFYETDSVHPIRFHVLRIGDVAVATNPFELFLDYGMRIQCRSKAVLTFLVQLSDSKGGYLPTATAIRGGGYSADKFVVSPEGAGTLVEETVAAINGLFP